MPVNPNPTYYQRSVLASKMSYTPNGIRSLPRTAFSFVGLDDFNRFIEQADTNCETNSRCRLELDDNTQATMQGEANRLGSKWFGTTDPALLIPNPTNFLFNNDLESFLQTVRSTTVNVDKTDLDQQKTIRFTDREVGVFSFDLASLGLVPVYEYYSTMLNKIVNANNVVIERDNDGKPIKDASGKSIFYHIYKEAIAEHYIIFDATLKGYYSKLLNRKVQPTEYLTINENGVFKYLFIEMPEIQRHRVEQKQVLNANGKKKFKTTFKKVFIEIPKIEKPLPRIDIIVSASYSSKVNAQTEMIYSSMAAISLAEKLSSAGVNYRIIVSYPIQTNANANSRKQVYTYVTLKKEGQVLDKNQIATMLSDGRSFRGNGFRGFIASMYDAGYDAQISGSIGSPIYDNLIILKNKDLKYEVVDVTTNTNYYGNREFDTEELAEEAVLNSGNNVNRVKNAYIDLLAQSTDPSDKEAAKRKDSKIIFSGALSVQDATNQYNTVIKQITRL